MPARPEAQQRLQRAARLENPCTPELNCVLKDAGLALKLE